MHGEKKHDVPSLHHLRPSSTCLTAPARRDGPVELEPPLDVPQLVDTSRNPLDPPARPPRTARARSDALHRAVLALDARLEEGSVSEDEDAAAADEPEEGRDRRADPQDRDPDDEEEHVQVLGLDRRRPELDRLGDEPVDADVALHAGEKEWGR